MSYIRCASNPEKLYIWGDVDKVAHISMGTETVGTLPVSVLDGLIKKYVDKYFEDCKYNCAEIKEINIEGEFKMQLSYKDQWKIVMWGVTWDYIVLSNYKRILNDILYYKRRNTKRQKVLQ